MKNKKQNAKDIRYVSEAMELLRLKMEYHLNERSPRWIASAPGAIFEQQISKLEDAITNLGEVADYLEE